jgi:hypothetical protein
MRWAKVQTFAGFIQHHEVVACTLHFGKADTHRVIID